MLRPLVLSLAAAAAAALAAPALALTVHVRVEGLNANLFGASEPLVTPFTGTLVADDGSTHTLSQPTALGALEAASRRGEFFYRLRVFSFGPFVDRIGRYPGAGSSGWVYKVNGASPPVGADKFVLKDGDRVLWYFARFGPEGGPDTLELVRSPRGCFRALARNDAGKAHQAQDVVFRLDGRGVRAAAATICPAGHWHRLRVTKPGAIASQVVRAR